MTKFIQIHPAEFAYLDARTQADIGISGPGEGVHASQIRRLPVVGREQSVVGALAELIRFMTPFSARATR